MPLIPLDEPAAALAALVRGRAPLPGVEERRPHTGAASPVTDGAPLETVLEGRRSVREFTAEPVSAATLLAVLDRAAQAQRDQWPVHRYGDPGLRLLLAVRSAEGLGRGLFTSAPDGTLRALGVPHWLDQLADDYAAAPVFALVCGSPSRVGPGAAGGLLVRVGSLGYAIWLAARTHGLECSVFGAGHYLVRQEACRLQPGARHLFTVALGHPARLPEAG
ncbi:nitroreductase family protein [Micromonospora luteifusca]|uniref:nitroreductase family protein n=1 Tax=Micromonospora luteifusca TaxID=709860 RepID=UPI00339E1D4D